MNLPNFLEENCMKSIDFWSAGSEVVGWGAKDMCSVYAMVTFYALWLGAHSGS